MEAHSHIFFNGAFDFNNRAFRRYTSSFLVLGFICGTAIDLDKLVASRIRYGDWHHLKNILKSPLGVLKSYKAAIDNPEDQFFANTKQRYISHFGVAIIFSTLIYLSNQTAGTIAAIFFAVHLSMDVIETLINTQK